MPFLVGVYVIVFIVLVGGLSVGLSSWLLGAISFVLVISLGLWLVLSPRRRKR